MISRAGIHQVGWVSVLIVWTDSRVELAARVSFSRERTTQPRFKVIETTRLDDGSKRYRVVDLVEGGSASKHGVFKLRAEADAVCSILNAEHSRQTGVGRASPSS
jgi:hypothetical protein